MQRPKLPRHNRNQGLNAPRLTPIERRLADVLGKLKLAAWPRYREGGFELDFALQDYLVGIEADGELYHSSLEAANRRDVKDAWFGSRGYKILHLTGSVIMNDIPLVIKLVRETVAGAERRPPTPIAKLRAESSAVIEGTVAKVWPPRDAVRGSGAVERVREVLLRDATGTILVVLRGSQIRDLSEGESLRVIDGCVGGYAGHLRVLVGPRGRVSKGSRPSSGPITKAQTPDRLVD